MNRPTKEVDRKDCAPFSKEALAIRSGTTRRFRRSRDHVLPAKGKTSNPQGPRGACRSWLMLAAAASLLAATSCIAENNGKCDPHRKAADINRQGILAHEVERARQEFHVDGSGVKVCVISDSVRYLDEAKENLTLPNVPILHRDGIKQDGIQLDRSDDGEGTAMLEVVHSIAPGAELGFATYKTKVAENIKALAEENPAWKKCDIIVDDYEDYAESPFQDEKVSEAINNVTGKRVLYITSAGNRGNTKSCTSLAWEGDFRAGTVLSNGRTMHVFSEEQNDEYNEVLCAPCPPTRGTVCHPIRGKVHARVFWNDPPSRNNRQSADFSGYELSAVDVKGHYLKGTDRLKDPKKPYYSITFTAPDGEEANRTWIAITKAAGKADRFLHLDINLRDLDEKNISNRCRLLHKTGGVISGHHGAASAFAVAAKTVEKSPPDLEIGAFVGGAAQHVKKSSSEGPRRMFFDRDGHRYDPPRVLRKPDVTAAEGVTTDVPGEFCKFTGTSAAAPQVAGIAALMWSKDRSLTAEDIKEALRESAIQIEGPEEWNPLSGYGIVNAVRALRAIETVKGRQASNRVCPDDYRRSSEGERPLQSSMAMRRSTPLK